ncbi:DUF4192 domain-containing protein [Aeromicrobium fastidiosum]|uniref:DUF4192 domain-containing protein n=1 Tax=Aeromicrobium fastidiosum TaxID=52699 RepID=UPI0020233CA7|nr:DUF4192 domain-containing protein [Aeromicrobium fastidiosum]MCL8250260.1 DUF4192 domain-containing protein [Aeromicrobium fastidiosum]
MTETPSTFVAHDASDLINALPTFFGFTPHESVVAVATHGPRRRFGFRLRVDVPAERDVDAQARQIVQHLRRNGAEGVVLIAVTRQQDLALRLLDAIHRSIDELPDLELVIRVRADGERYWTDSLGAPAEGVAYTTSSHHLSIVQAVAAGQQILPDRASLVERFAAVVGERRRWLERSTDEIVAEVVRTVARTDPDQLGAVGMSVVGPILDRALDGRRLLDADLVRVAVWVSGVEVRDAVWARITRETADDMLRVLTLVAGSVVPPFEPAVLSLAAFAAWLTGDGAQALIAVERALDADPCYSMARIVLDVLEQGVSPVHWTGFVEGAACEPGEA